MTGIDDESYPPVQIHLQKNQIVDDDDTMITFEPSTSSSGYYHRIKSSNKSTSIIRKVEEEEVEEPYDEVDETIELKGWKDESQCSIIRDSRSLFRRTVTIFPDKPAPPKKTAEELALEAKEENSGGLFGKVVNDWKNAWKALNLLPSDDNAEELKMAQSRNVGSPDAAAAASLLLWDPLLGALPAAPDTTSTGSDGDSPTKVTGRVQYDSKSGTLRDSLGNQLSSAPLFQKSLDDIPLAHLLMLHGSCGSSAHFQSLLLALHKNLCSSNKDEKQQKTTKTATTTITAQGNFSPDDDEESTRTTRMLLQHLNGRPIQCHLFDAFGCGKSTNPTTDWEAFSQQEIAKDLEQIFQSIIDLQKDDIRPKQEPVPIFLVGHAHGSSQIIDLINGLSNHQKSFIKGVIFISGALSDGPVEQISESSCSGGKCIWRLPDFVLDWIQPRLLANDNFFINTNTLGPSAQHLKTAPDVAVAKACYRQTKWADSESANKIKQKVLLIHGEFDHVIPVIGGKHLDDHLSNSNLVIVRESSHMVFQERPEVVSELILDFISKQLNLKNNKDPIGSSEHDETNKYY